LHFAKAVDAVGLRFAFSFSRYPLANGSRSHCDFSSKVSLEGAGKSSACEFRPSSEQHDDEHDEENGAEASPDIGTAEIETTTAKENDQEYQQDDYVHDANPHKLGRLTQQCGFRFHLGGTGAILALLASK
jgi:hypothetical protein